MPVLRLTAVALAASALLTGACGGRSTTGQAGQATSTTASTLASLETGQPAASQPPSAPPSARSSVLPDLVVDDVGAGTKVNLATLVPSTEPVLVWFWAPH